MVYCTYCGALLTDGARFCSSCGAAVTQETIAVSVTPSIATTVYTGDGYAVMLVSTGSCALTTAANLISDTCGYTDAEALNLVSNTPTLIAQSLNQSQAVYLAQCVTEYGMEAAIYDRNGNQTFASDVNSVFDSSGSLLAKVAGTLGLIGIGNRIAGAVRRLTLPSRPPVYTLPNPVPKPQARRYKIARQAPPQHQHPEQPRREPPHPEPHAQHGMQQRQRMEQPQNGPAGQRHEGGHRSENTRKGPGRDRGPGQPQRN